jgi:hypothetical protein
MDSFALRENTTEFANEAAKVHESSWAENRATSSGSDCSMASSSHGSSPRSSLEENMLATSTKNSTAVSPTISTKFTQSPEGVLASPILSIQHQDEEPSHMSQKTETEVSPTSKLNKKEISREKSEKLEQDAEPEIAHSPIPYLVEAREDDVFHSPAPRRRLRPTVTATYDPPPLPLYASEPILSSMQFSSAHRHKSWKNQQGVNMTVRPGHLARQYSASSQIEHRQHLHWASPSLKQGQNRTRSQSESNWQFHQRESQTTQPGYFSSACSLGSPSESSQSSSTSSRSGSTCSQKGQRPVESASFESLAEALVNENGNGPAPLYRRFQVLNHRVLLHLQDEISKMERGLMERDEEIKEFSHQNVNESDPFNESPYEPRESPESELAAHLQMRTELLGRIFIKLGQYSEQPCGLLMTANYQYRSSFNFVLCCSWKILTS